LPLFVVPLFSVRLLRCPYPTHVSVRPRFGKRLLHPAQRQLRNPPRLKKSRKLMFAQVWSVRAKPALRTSQG